MHDWNLTSWRTKPCIQQPVYPSATKVIEVTSQLASLPPLVTPYEIDMLKQRLALASQGKAFVLQGGDCAECFDKCQENDITSKFKIILQMSLVLLHGLQKPIIKIGRMAGQYAKPRTHETETRNKQTLPVYRGDMINHPNFTTADRTPNPDLLLKAYHYSALTHNYIRALIDGGFANLEHPENWDLDFIVHSPLSEKYKKIVDSVHQTVSLIKSVNNHSIEHLKSTEFFTSHEGLHLHYEQALTRQSPDNKAWYNLSTHFPWIGMRTTFENSAHVEYFRGIVNPIAIKIGPTMSPEKLIAIISILNPHNTLGRLTLIHRMGAEKIQEMLPPLIKAVKKSNKHVLWMNDPMHGNTTMTCQGKKTRYFLDIIKELQYAFAIHADHDTYLGGVHLELTGENVTECIGGARGPNEMDLESAYETLVDPRLNYEQALELALSITNLDFVSSPHPTFA